MIQNQQKNITYYTFENLTAANGVHHLFSTRLGGVSKGAFESMNLNFKTGDRRDAVMQNLQGIADLGFPLEDMVFPHQTHHCQVREVSAADRGKGIFSDRDYTDIDGLITNDPSVTLVTFYADCVPLYLYDPVQRAIGLSHAGWRGTVGQIGMRTVRAMTEGYGSKPQDILVGIGPSICKDCFEVGNEVAEEFARTLDFAAGFISPCMSKAHKSYIDLQGINKQSLLNAGVLAENIELPGICTKENPELFYSHRVMGAKRGSLAAFMRLCVL
jgi:YfiH family protein